MEPFDNLINREEYTELIKRIEALEAKLSLYDAGTLQEIDLKSIVLYREPPQ